MRDVKNSSYDIDDGHYLTDFLEYLDLKKKAKKTRDAVIETYANVNIPSFDIKSTYRLSSLELNSLYNVCGYIFHSITNICKTCSECQKLVLSSVPIHFQFTQFVTYKCFKPNVLCYANIESFEIFVRMEHMFIYYSSFFF